MVRTRQREYRKSEANPFVQKMTKRLYAGYPALEQKLESMNSDYNKQCDELVRLENEGRIFTIAPSKPVNVSRVEGDVDKLADLYYMGYLDGLNQIQRIKEYLEID